jgi:hypothetical protein
VSGDDDTALRLDDLPSVSETVATHGLAARKSLGQHFLFDLNLTRRIARAAGPLARALARRRPSRGRDRA